MILDPGGYSYGIYTIEKKDFWGNKSYETEISLKDSRNHLINCKHIKEDDINRSISIDSLYYQSLRAECINYLLNDANEFFNDYDCEFDYVAGSYIEHGFIIKNYSIGDRLKTSNILIEASIIWDFGDHPNKNIELYKLEHFRISHYTGYYLYFNKDSAKIEDGYGNLIYTFPNPKRIFAQFCLALIYNNFGFR